MSGLASLAVSPAPARGKLLCLLYLMCVLNGMWSAHMQHGLEMEQQGYASCLAYWQGYASCLAYCSHQDACRAQPDMCPWMASHSHAL